jgi:acetoin utilization deacetylase AcuC-like enzyme
VPLATKVVWSDDCLLHDPDAEIWVGVRTDATEVPARVRLIRDALEAEGGRIVGAAKHPDDSLLRVHDASLVDFLRSAWQNWTAAGLPHDPGQSQVVPYVFAHTALMPGREPPHVPAATWARTGYFAYDTMTLIGPGTWEAARAGADVALTAATEVLGGEPIVYACTRPPGHHVCSGVYGGSCYLNNAAIAAAELAERGARVAVLDVDAHHGNGTQEIFYTREDLRTASVHVDPGAGWFPHFVGFAGEDGNGGNRNLPLAPGAADEEWCAAVADLVRWVEDADVLVVALGVDAAAEDPESPLRVSVDGYRTAGRSIGALGTPTVVVQEGGYDLAHIGELVVAFLTGLEEGRP